MTASAPDMGTLNGLVPGQSPEPLLLPDPTTLFSHRAKRLRQLAQGHAMGAWLSFIADIADAQNDLAVALVENPPQRQWRRDLEALSGRLRDKLPLAALPAVESLLGQDEGRLVALADRLMSFAPTAEDLPAAPIAMAALQLAWTRHAAAIDPTAFAVSATAARCPVCGAPPVAGVIHVGMASGRLRYLHCGLCQTAWHHIRAACVACGDGKDVSYRLIEGRDDGVRAETCDACKSYLKLLLVEKAPDLDPLADDLASVGLDILVGEEGYRRFGANPFLLQSDSSVLTQTHEPHQFPHANPPHKGEGV
ncbi:formate dehydrogenase accessory protein FdhE [Telmatospirillum sp.]|uniref:formate dehydrogenase accessory protein FdhE n=1 Tax=Telmatospirillum sp. TaxID=2079197 RepID=UPI002843F5D7|nr:formate dehydrogenase accessory protein FdhE [Telmatospirillum sp.]MDR3437568.1 formate dehydrogenase accessory protein FdhE [Telmatospirillum sp.]